MGGRFALLIATFEYEDETLRRLEAPRYDVESLASVLRDPAVGEFEVETLINEPLEVVGNAIHEFHRNRRSSDLTLLYFTGHGVKDARGQLYLALKNTRKSNLLFSGLPAVALDESLSECRSREKILVLDCCYSGAFPAGRLAKGATDVGALEQLGGRGRAVLTASDSTQYSFEGVAVNEEGISAPSSVFTRYMVEGLRSGKADLDGDGVISLDELYGYVYDRVLEEAPEQRPKKKDDVEGRIVVAANSRWAVPEYIRSDLMSPIASTRLSAVDALAALYRGPKVIRSEVLGVLRPFSEDDSKQVSARAVEHVERLQAIEQAERERAEQDKAERERAEQD
ncbi:caspase family protein, partial [Actinomycetospora sp. C-140]